MARKLYAIFITCLLFINYSFSTEVDWQSSVERIRSKIVLIEYFEQLNSPEAIVEKGKIKKYLTGIMVDKNGLVMTSSSIFRANLEFSNAPAFFNPYSIPTDIRVKTTEGQYIPAEFVGKDDDKKIAFIRLKQKNPTSPIAFSLKNSLKLGTRLLIIQHLPQQYRHELMVNERIVNAVIPKPQLKYLCENNTRSLSGFGIVLDETQKAIGITQPSGGSAGGDYDYHDYQSQQPAEIIPFANFQKLIKNPPVYKQKETSRKKWLGIYMQAFPRKMARYFGNDSLHGVLVNTVFDESPAEAAGIQRGDIIVSIKDNLLFSEKDDDLSVFRKLIREQEDEQVIFKIYRDGKIQTVQVTLGETPISSYLADEYSHPEIGFSVKELTQDIILAKQLDFDTQGVWVSKVERASWADVAGLRVSDLIIKMNDFEIQNLADVENSIEKIEQNQPDYVSLFIQRRTDTRFLFIKTNF